MGKVIHPVAVAVLLALSAHTVAGAQTMGTADGTLSTGEADVTRDLGALAPEFRARLERVLDRMTREFGPGVAVIETWRSQTRQDALYAQGRTRPGPVVTWTRSSAHLSGYAADVKIASVYARRGAYARLASIARSEGLRTLGARDPGHLELPRVRGRYAGAPPAGSARALSRIVASKAGAMPPSDPTVFAASPYAEIMTGPSGFAGVPPAGYGLGQAALGRERVPE